MRVVLDTNILISAFLFEKRLGKIVKLIEQGVVIPCFVVYTFREFQKVLGYEKFKSLLEASGTDVEEIVRQMQNQGIILNDPEIVPNATPDAPDNYVLVAAKISDAECIVTGDKLLLSLKDFELIPIITPQEFLQKFTYPP
jgi:putative PIN family toxin of toxin-antitoxin system